MAKAHPNRLPEGEDRAAIARVEWPKPTHVRQDMAISEYPTSLDLTTERGRALMIGAMNPGELDFGTAGQCRIVATDWLIFPDVSTDPETGEQREVVRTVLITADGRTFRTASEFGPKVLARVLGLYPPDRWRQGIEFVVTERRSRKTGRTWHDVRPALPQEPVP